MIEVAILREIPAIKICGLRRQSDLDFCIQNRVEYVGFNFYKGSKRYIQPESAARLWANRSRTLDIGTTCEGSQAVAVVVNPSRIEISAIFNKFPDLSVIQFHGAEPQDLIDWVRRAWPRLKIWRAFGVRTLGDVKRASESMGVANVDLALFDTAAPVETAPGSSPYDLADSTGGQTTFGGTGVAFNWDYLTSAPPTYLFGIAGGIRTEILPQLMTAVQKSGCKVIDIASGVERAPGEKDEHMMAQLIDGVRRENVYE